MSEVDAHTGTVETRIPARLDRGCRGRGEGLRRDQYASY
jgi:hypothetical protein